MAIGNPDKADPDKADPDKGNHPCYFEEGKKNRVFGCEHPYCKRMIRYYDMYWQQKTEMTFLEFLDNGSYQEGIVFIRDYDEYYSCYC
jgi:hypothetical protein